MEETEYRGDLMRVKEIENKVNEQDTRIDEIVKTLNTHNERIDDIDDKLISQGQRIDDIDDKLTSQGQRIDDINDKLTSQGQQIDDINDKLISQGQQIDDINDKLTSQGQQINDKLTSQGQQINDINDKLNAHDQKIEQSNFGGKINATLNRYPIIGIVLSAILWPILSFAFVYIKLPDQLDDMQTSIDDMQEQIDTLDRNIKYINKKLDIDIDFATVPDGFIEDSEEMNPNATYLASEIRLTEDAIDALSIEEHSRTMVTLGNPSWDDEEIVAQNINNGETYTAQEIIGIPLLIPYTDGEYDIIFYGQYDETFCWNGECITNTYDRNKKLCLITDATYENGNCKSYEQIIQDVSSSNEKEWIISDRTREIDPETNQPYNDGTSKIYSRESDYLMDFDFSSATLDNVLTVDEFRKNIEDSDNIIQTGYYSGRTSDGKYNDNTDDAYLVYFSDDGYVDLLYHGHFKDGKFEDDTGDAWYIVKDGNGLYGYFKGTFSMNKRDETEENIPIAVPYEDINSYIKDYNFDCELNWYDNRNK